MQHKQQVMKIMQIELFHKKVNQPFLNGEVLYNSLKLIVEIFLNVGAFLLVSKIGISASDINNETKING